MPVVKKKTTRARKIMKLRKMNDLYSEATKKRGKLVKSGDLKKARRI
jgi:hypothetical protein